MSSPDEKRDPSESGTDGRILASAIVLFAERGFSEVTVREIADHADANPAAINYYFGGKERLIRQAIRAVLLPLNEARLAALAAATSPGTPLSAEAVVRALVEPTVSACMRSTDPDRYYARILLHTFALRQPFVDEVMSEQTDQILTAFVDALARALPGAPRARLFWHYDFIIGALLHILIDGSRGHRLRRVSDGAADTASERAVVEELVAFIMTGLGGSSAS